jgi:hypothetical protein
MQSMRRTSVDAETGGPLRGDTSAVVPPGRWQSVMLVELDGPRSRTVGIQIMGYA